MSNTAPVALWYAVMALVASKSKVVPVSTIPAVVDKMVVEAPYLTLWLIPQNSLDGKVEVSGAKPMDPVNFELSVPPHVISPFNISSLFVGLNEIPISFAEMILRENALSVTVGIRVFVAGDNVPKVRSTGPIPRIPSVPSNPEDVDATPIDCWGITSPGAIVTVSVNSVPEKEPDPYDTDTLLLVCVLVPVLL